jgi:hypothetical protein
MDFQDSMVWMKVHKMLTLDDAFGGRGGSNKTPKEVDNKKFYEILSVDQKASADEIRKSYRKKAVTLHPDKGGDQQKVY